MTVFFENPFPFIPNTVRDRRVTSLFLIHMTAVLVHERSFLPMTRLSREDGRERERESARRERWAGVSARRVGA